MKNNICAIIGLVLVGISAVFGFIVNVDASVIISIAVAFLGATLLVVNALTNAKKENKLDWKLWVAVIGSAIGGCLCAIGGVTENMITAIVGAVITIATIIFGFIAYGKKEK